MALDGTHERQIARRAMGTAMLTAEAEHELAVAWRDRGDEDALHQLVNAYLRLAVSVARKFRRYGAPMNDLIQEASVGLMKAAERFDPDRGVRFSTYAVWWIKASVQDYVMRNWSMVRTGSTSAQKALFFNLRRVQARLQREAEQQGQELNAAELSTLVAHEMGVSERDVEVMTGRLTGSDLSLNAPQKADEEGREWVDLLEDPADSAEAVVTARRDTDTLRSWLVEAMGALTPREASIVTQRRLTATPRTLESLGDEMGLSKERIRQLEAQAFTKMRKTLERDAPEVQNFFA
ncbi:RNA polymerase sigma 70 [Actibacterium mucosum KCTC 23349]|uniref:RNA polymerase sigma 70 n=1 Tax=Actibacterium mucosum KCTC 23349 TaxID=1454373 RepID=A0A037ZHQ1_9RHOB|nr:RNA polymerase factor sigma-32 [Actibacterium mucosum]KAJ55072.1 RNA polymerase sigma 70 [Actibacterium mucosum KCTC 23349]